MRHRFVGVFSLTMLAVLYAADLQMPVEFHFTLIYATLIAFTAWFAGRSWGVAVAALAAIGSYVAEPSLGGSLFLDAWSAFTRLGAYVGGALAFALVREREAYLTRLDKFRTDLIASLERELPRRLVELDHIAREQPGVGGAGNERLRRAIADLAILSRNFVTLGLLHATPAERVGHASDLNEIVREAVRGLPAQRSRIILSVPPRAQRIRADARPLTAAVSNLVEAALPLVEGYLDLAVRPERGATVLELRPHEAEPNGRARALEEFEVALAREPSVALADHALSVDLARLVVSASGGTLVVGEGDTGWSLAIRFPLARV